jgi:hypothetical protein
MKLEEVMPALRAGKKIKLKEWTDLSYIDNSIASCVGSIQISYLFRDDWEIVEEKKCYLCNGHNKLLATPLHQYQGYPCKIINCPECCVRIGD